MNSFIAWVGGKHLLAKDIVFMMPPHVCYVEVFGGAAWTLFKKPPEISETEVYNDINPDLVNLFRVVRDHQPEFYWRQYFLLSSRSEYQAYQERFKTGAFKDDIERAIAFYYIVKNSFGSRVIGGTYAYARKGHFRYNVDFAILAAIKERLKKVYIENLPFTDLIPRYDSPNTLFYCDPPYTVTVKGHYYQFNFNDADHRRLFDVLSRIKGKFILSYNDVPLIRTLYKDHYIKETKPIRYSTNNTGKSKPVYKTELIIKNY